MKTLEEQIDGFLNEKNITPYQHIYNADGDTGWDIEVLMEEFAERYAQQRVSEMEKQRDALLEALIHLNQAAWDGNHLEKHRKNAAYLILSIAEIKLKNNEI